MEPRKLPRSLLRGLVCGLRLLRGQLCSLGLLSRFLRGFVRSLLCCLMCGLLGR